MCSCIDRIGASVGEKFTSLLCYHFGHCCRQDFDLNVTGIEINFKNQKTKKIFSYEHLRKINLI